MTSAFITENTSFLEKLVLADDRLAVIDSSCSKKNEPYWFWRLLTLQTRFGSSLEKDAKVLASTLDMVEQKDGNKRDGWEESSKRIQNLLLRQALINFTSSTGAVRRKTIVTLKGLIGPNLNAAKESAGDKPAPQEKTYPSTLTVATARLLKKQWDDCSLKKDKRILEHYTPAAFSFLANQNLDPPQIDSFLNLMESEAPEIPYLLTLIKKDLTLNKTPFGSKKIHFRLTLQQLELLGKKTQELKDSEPFLRTYAAKLQKVSEIDLRYNQEARGKYLERLKKFSADRVKKCNSLRAVILYNWLQFQETRGKYDKTSLAAYLSIPKNASYNKELMAAKAISGEVAKMDYQTDMITALRPIGDDEPVIRRHLRFIFQRTEESISKWKDVVDLSYLRILYAECRLISGAGNAADLRKAYTKSKGKYAYTQLQDRVTIELLPSNKIYYEVNDPVVLKLLVKNVPELRVRVYEINAKNYYLKYKNEIDINVPLDGLEPSYETVKSYSEAPLLQKERTIEVPQIRDKLGVFLIEFVGQDQMARTIIRKGELRFVARQETLDENKDGYLGYVFTVVNEKNQHVKESSVSIGGKEYFAEKDGRVRIPFGAANNPHEPVVLDNLKRPGSGTLQYFNYRTENYRMEAGLFLDRESLLERQMAQVIVRPSVFLNEFPISVANLESPQLTLKTTNGEGETVTKTYRLELRDNAESITPFSVPTELRQVDLTFSANVKVNSQNRTIELVNSGTFQINTIDDTDALADLHLIPRGATGYVMAVCGKNGEPVLHQVVNLKLRHRFFQKKLEFTVASNGNGLIFLGHLPDVSAIEARTSCKRPFSADIKVHKWSLLQDKVNIPRVVNVKEGEVVRIPFMSANQAIKVDVYDMDFVQKFKAVTFRGGYIEINNLPAGDFIAMIRDQQEANVLIHVSKGSSFAGHMISESRIVEMSERVALQIVEVKGNREKGYKVQLEGYNKNTRVHVFSTFLVPRFSSFDFLASPNTAPQVFDFIQHPTIYSQQGSVSEEFKYISSRRASEKLNGNLLPRPTFLLNKWSCDNEISKRPRAIAPPANAPLTARRVTQRYDRALERVIGSDKRREHDPSNLEFLKEPSRICTNLIPDSAGWVTIPPDAITISQNLVQIVAVDENNTALRNVILQASNQQKYKDTRLMDGLDPSKHFTEVREVLLMPKTGDNVTYDNWKTSQVETYDDLADVFELYRAIAGTTSKSALTQIQTFEFLTLWDALSEDQKLNNYDQFNCHEVNFFIKNKDPAFFKKVVQPFVANKLEKDFMDYYVLDDKKAMEGFLSLDQFTTLNTLEKILLASCIDSIKASTLRNIKEFAGLTAKDVQGSDNLFKMALLAKQLTTENLGKQLGFDSLTESKEAPNTLAQDQFVDLTRTFQESRYYQVSFENQKSELIKPTRFWADYAEWLLGGASGAFLSKHFGRCTSNTSESLLALSVLGLPFRDVVKPPTVTYLMEGKEIQSYQPGSKVVISVNGPTMLLSRQIQETEFRSAALSVSTNYFDPKDPFEIVDFEKVDKFLQMPLFRRKIYGCRIVITNVSSITHTVEVLAQIPTGAVPVKNGFRTKNLIVPLDPYKTTRREFYFYFPEQGKFTHFPTHVAKNGQVIGFGLEDPNIEVVDPESVIDTTSWDYYSQKCPDKELLEYLRNTTNITELDLSRVAWRCSEERFFLEIANILRRRQIYCEDIWAYSMHHFANKELEEYLTMNPKYADMMKPNFSASTLACYNACDNRDFAHMEFWHATDLARGLTNARAHGAEVQNEEFNKQWKAFLQRALYRSYSVTSIPGDDKMACVYYLLVQDRVEEATTVFKTINEDAARKVAEFAYDYMFTYLAFCSGDPNDVGTSSNITAKWLKRKLPPSLRKLWMDVRTQMDELKDMSQDGGVFGRESAAVIAERERKQLSFEATAEHRIVVKYKNITQIDVYFYKLDLEMMFSTAPFRTANNTFNWVQPQELRSLVLEPDTEEIDLPVPDTLIGQNFFVEVKGGGLIAAKPKYDNELNVQVSTEVGDIRVINRSSGRPIAKAYVKVYAKGPKYPNGIFFKDGYTDLRGRFTFNRVSSDLLEDTKKLALLVMTESAGAEVLEIAC